LPTAAGFAAVGTGAAEGALGAGAAASDGAGAPDVVPCGVGFDSEGFEDDFGRAATLVCVLLDAAPVVEAESVSAIAPPKPADSGENGLAVSAAAPSQNAVKASTPKAGESFFAAAGIDGLAPRRSVNAAAGAVTVAGAD